MRIQSLALFINILPFGLCGVPPKAKTQGARLVPAGSTGKTKAAPKAMSSGADKGKKLFQEVHLTSVNDRQCIAKLILELLRQEEEGVDIVTSNFSAKAFTTCPVDLGQRKASFAEHLLCMNAARDRKNRQKRDINVFVEAQHVYAECKTDQEKYEKFSEDRAMLTEYGVSYTAQPCEKEAKDGSLHRFILFRKNRYAGKDVASHVTARPLLLLGMWCFDRAAIQGKRADIVVVTDDELKLKVHTDELRYAMNISSKKGRIQDNLPLQFSEASWQGLECLDGLVNSKNDISWSHQSVSALIAVLISSEEQGFSIVLPHIGWMLDETISNALTSDVSTKVLRESAMYVVDDSSNLDNDEWKTVQLRMRSLIDAGYTLKKLKTSSVVQAHRLFMLFCKNRYAKQKGPLLLLGSGRCFQQHCDYSRAALNGFNVSQVQADKVVAYLKSSEELLLTHAIDVDYHDIMFDERILVRMKELIESEQRQVDIVTYSFSPGAFKQLVIEPSNISEKATVYINILVHDQDKCQPESHRGILRDQFRCLPGSYKGVLKDSKGPSRIYQVSIALKAPNKQRDGRPPCGEGLHHKLMLFHNNKVRTDKSPGESLVMTGAWHPNYPCMQGHFASGMVLTNDVFKLSAYKNEVTFLMEHELNPHDPEEILIDADYPVDELPELSESAVEAIAQQAGTRAYHVFFNRLLKPGVISDFIVKIIEQTTGTVQIVVERFGLPKIAKALVAGHAAFKKEGSCLLTNNVDDLGEKFEGQNDVQRDAISRIARGGVEVFEWCHEKVSETSDFKTMLVLKGILFSEVKHEAGENAGSPLLLMGSMNLTNTCENGREDNMALFRDPSVCEAFGRHVEKLKGKSEKRIVATPKKASKPNLKQQK